MNEPSLEERVAAFDKFSYNELAQAMLAAQDRHAELKAQASAAWNDLCLITRNVIPARLDRDGIQNVTVILPDGTKKQMLVMDQVSVKTPPDKKSELWDWLKENDAAELISETVNSSTLAAFVREQMKAGNPYPNEICEVSTYQVTSLRKA